MRIAWIVLAVAPLWAQTPAQTPPRTVTLQDLEKMALAGNPSLAQAEAGSHAALGRARQAGLYPNPILGATGDHNTPVFNGGSLGGFAEQRIVMGGKLGLSRHAADQDAAAAMEFMPANVRRALAQQPQPRLGFLRDIKHVVVLMQENRSFDHYFGTLSGVRGFDDPTALKLSDGRSVFYQPDADNPRGYMLPFHLDTQGSSAQRIPSTSHAWAVVCIQVPTSDVA